MTRAERVERLAENLLSDAERLRVKLWEKRTASLLDGTPIELSHPEFKDQKDILLSAAIAIDKSQLLAGHATARVETLEPEQATDRIAELQRQWRERQAQAS